MENSAEFLHKIVQLPCDPEVPLLGIYPEEFKSELWRDICTLMFIAALFTRAKIKKQPVCPSTDEWLKKMWYMHIMEYYPVFKKKEILPFRTS